jgi:hypothetical protein
MNCKKCGWTLERSECSGQRKHLKFHCVNPQCNVSFIRREYDNHRKTYTDKVVYCVI